MLEALAESEAAPLRCHAFNLTDEEFRGLPKAKRDTIIAKLRLMQKFSRKIVQRSLRYALSGESAKSEELLVALRRLARENQGPELFKTADQVGQALEYFVDLHLAQFDRRKYPMPTSYLGRPTSAIKE
ncbi:MAG: hypothetical protein IIB53_14625 [Planctomycetes bacterium]|nr:hypothetical protein [Planctomycetota bacterium]